MGKNMERNEKTTREENIIVALALEIMAYVRRFSAMLSLTWAFELVSVSFLSIRSAHCFAHRLRMPHSRSIDFNSSIY